MKLFISYSRKNQEFAYQLATDLESLGYSVWIDKKEISVSEDWPHEIEAGLRESDVLLLLVSQPAMLSKNVADEWYFFWEEGKRIVPLLLEEAELPFQLRRIQYLDFTQGEYKANLKKLDETLQLPFEPATVNSLPPNGVPPRPRTSHSLSAHPGFSTLMKLFLGAGIPAIGILLVAQVVGILPAYSQTVLSLILFITILVLWMIALPILLQVKPAHDLQPLTRLKDIFRQGNAAPYVRHQWQRRSGMLALIFLTGFLFPLTYQTIQQEWQPQITCEGERGGVRIMVADFKRGNESIDRSTPDRFYNELVSQYNPNAEVCRLERRAPRRADQAKNLAERYNATLMIWGIETTLYIQPVSEMYLPDYLLEGSEPKSFLSIDRLESHQEVFYAAYIISLWYEAQGDTAQASIVLSKALSEARHTWSLERQRALTPFYFLVGYYYQILGERARFERQPGIAQEYFDHSIEYYTYAIEQAQPLNDPNIPYFHLNRLAVYALAGECETVREEFETYFASSGAYHDLADWAVANRARCQPSHARALMDFEKAIHADKWSGLVELALYLRDEGEFTQALQTFEQALPLSLDAYEYSEVVREMGLVQLDAGLYDEALQIYERYISCMSDEGRTSALADVQSGRYARVQGEVMPIIQLLTHPPQQEQGITSCPFDER